MRNLTKQFTFLLLSCVTIIFSSKALAAFSNPFVPVCTSKKQVQNTGTNANSVCSNEVESTIIENMPAYKSQDEIGDCRAFSMGTVVQKFICDSVLLDSGNKMNCLNPPIGYDVANFGMLAYTNRKPQEPEAFRPGFSGGRTMYDIITDFAENGSSVILDSCKSFDKIVNNLVSKNVDGTMKKDKLFSYLKQLYDSKKNSTEAGVTDCAECLNEINKNSGLNVNFDKLKNALGSDNYDKFLYSLFFSDCEMKPLLLDIKTKAYPPDRINATAVDMKNKVVEVLKKGKPVIYQNICIVPKQCDEGGGGHTTVISGHKKVCNGDNSVCKEMFKIHNSWGKAWQDQNNDGWVDADIILQNSIQDDVKDQPGKKRFISGNIVWLE